jgi:hypothetical protein
MSLPLMVWFIAGVRPADTETHRWHALSSISGYYHTSGVVAFVGVLAALAVYLLTYRGFDNEHGKWDRWAARTAGVCAALVALFPTDVASPPHWLYPWVSKTHYLSAALLFSCFAFFSLYLFTRSKGVPDDGKRKRNRLYVGYGIAIVACLLWIVIVKVIDLRHKTESSIFWPETFALIAFALSWLTKGRADQPIKGAAKKVAHGVQSGFRQLSGAK